jgi:hypothetical protein
MHIRRPRHAPVFAVLLGCWVWGQAPLAFAQPVSLAGRWQAEPMTVRWVIGEWGDACGPRPSGGGDPGGEVNIELKNDELVIAGGERSYSSEQCWEMHPGLDRQSHAKGSRSWATTCRTKPNDSRQEILQTTISASDDVITFRESGQYQFSLQGQTCSASSGRWRTYRRLPTGTETTPEPEPVPAPSASPRELPSDAPRRPCANPGAPARIEVRPARKLMRAGESFSFRASVFDARGCVLRTPVSWELVDSSGTAQTPGADPSAKLEGGALQIAPGAPDAELNVVATAASQSVKVTVGVVSNERYNALLASGHFTADGASIEAATATITSGSFGAGDSAPEPAAPSHKWTFVALVSGIALCLGVVGVVLLRRAERTGKTPLEPGTLADEPRPTAARAEPGAATRFDPLPAAPLNRGGTVCPICGTLYPSRDLKSCPKDGAQLLPINA